MIDLLTANEVLSKEQLKARAMSRLSESGLGLAERLANLERIAYHTLDPIKYPLVDRTQVDAIGAALLGVEGTYAAECADNDKLVLVLSYEAAQRRLAIPAVTLTTDTTQEQVDADTAERTAAQGIVTAASAATVSLHTSRLPK